MNEPSEGHLGDDEVVSRRVSAYLYPWDLADDPGVLSRLSSSGSAM